MPIHGIHMCACVPYISLMMNMNIFIHNVGSQYRQNTLVNWITNGKQIIYIFALYADVDSFAIRAVNIDYIWCNASIDLNISTRHYSNTPITVSPLHVQRSNHPRILIESDFIYCFLHLYNVINDAIIYNNYFLYVTLSDASSIRYLVFGSTIALANLVVNK